MFQELLWKFWYQLVYEFEDKITSTVNGKCSSLTLNSGIIWSRVEWMRHEKAMHEWLWIFYLLWNLCPDQTWIGHEIKQTCQKVAHIHRNDSLKLVNDSITHENKKKSSQEAVLFDQNSRPTADCYLNLTTTWWALRTIEHPNATSQQRQFGYHERFTLVREKKFKSHDTMNECIRENKISTFGGGDTPLAWQPQAPRESTRRFWLVSANRGPSKSSRRRRKLQTLPVCRLHLFIWFGPI